MDIKRVMNLLKLQDEVELIEMLKITSEDIVMRFQDRIEERLDTIGIELDE